MKFDRNVTAQRSCNAHVTPILSSGAALLLIALLGCGVPERPESISLSKLSSFRPATPADVKNFEQAMAAIITVAREDLNLPVADPVGLRLYKNSLSFAVYGFGGTTLPVDVAYASASASGNTIHIDLQKTEGYSWEAVVRVLAHEYGHTVHSALAGRHAHGSRWFSEGFAEWVSARVLDALGWQDYAVALQRANQELIRHQQLLPFENLKRWNYLSSEPNGSVKTYSLALAFVDRLIQKKGFSAMLEYLRSGDFKGSFGLSQETFLADFKEQLYAIQPAQPTFLFMARPEWKIGDQWTYVEKRAGTTTKLVKKLVRDDLFRGLPCFVIRVGEEEHFYAKPTLSLIATEKHGKLVTKNSKPDQILSWPLKAGIEWQNNFFRQDVEKGFTREINYLVVVANAEKVTVPAGTFEAAKVQAYGSRSGRLMAEFWYSPEVKWLVQSRTYRRDEGFVEQKLVGFVHR